MYGEKGERKGFSHVIIKLLAYYIKWYFLYNRILFSFFFTFLFIFVYVELMFFVQRIEDTHFLCGCIFKGCGNWRIHTLFRKRILIYCLEIRYIDMFWVYGVASKEITTICVKIFWDWKLNREYAYEASTQEKIRSKWRHWGD